jgi:MFS family permease
METAVGPRTRWYQGISRPLWFILVATYVGWLLDSMDLNLFTVVLRPSMAELLGHAATPAAIGFYGGLVVAVTLVGWGVGGLTFGVLGDYLGRSRTLVLTILAYSVFTALGAAAGNWWELAIARFLAAWGVGGEWAVGTALINETWPGRSRVAASGVMMSAFGLGYLLAGLVNLLVGPAGWRWVFLVGVVPGVIAYLMRRGLPESGRWQEAAARRRAVQERRRGGSRVTQEESEMTGFTLYGVFRPPWLRNTVAATLMAFAATAGFWGTQTWIPALAGQLAARQHANVVHVVSVAVIILNVAAIAGLLLFAWLTEVLGRRGAFFVASLGNMAVLPVVFLGSQSYQALYWTVPLMGLFTNGIFGIFTPYLPELYPTRLRATGAGFCFNVARIASAVGPFVAGTLVGVFGGIGRAAAFMAVSYVIGAVAVWFAPETRGRPLPE